MNFKYKCFLQHLFSALPNGQQLNYIFQRHVTRTIPFSGAKFLIQTRKALVHYRNFEQYYELEAAVPRYYEFGAGWDLIIPLYFSRLGFEASVIDIKRLVRKELVNDTIDKLNNEKSLLLPEGKILGKVKLLSDLKEVVGLNYVAPADARATDFRDNYFDFVTSTSTFEHIPPEDILNILKETYRVIKKGGIFSLTINYTDHWSHFDGDISIYNFLKYSAREWKKYNPALQYQNRLRHPDYIAIIGETGFQIMKEVPILPDANEKEQLKNIKLAEEFRKYSPYDLGIKRSEIVLKK